MRLSLQFFSWFLRCFENALRGQHALARRCDIPRLKDLDHVLLVEKNPACLRLAELSKLHLKLKNFFQSLCPIM
jgi:hypothetical protein